MDDFLHWIGIGFLIAVGFGLAYVLLIVVLGAIAWIDDKRKGL